MSSGVRAPLLNPTVVAAWDSVDRAQHQDGWGPKALLGRQNDRGENVGPVVCDDADFGVAAQGRLLTGAPTAKTSAMAEPCAEQAGKDDNPAD